MAPPPNMSSGRELQFKISEGPPKRRQNRKRDAWSEVENEVVYLHKQWEMPWRLVREIMWCLYGFEASESAYKKKFPGRSESQGEEKTRDKSRLKSHSKAPEVEIQTDMVSLTDFAPQKRVAKRNATISSTQQCLEPQEQIFLGLDEFIREVFSPSAGGWGNDMLRFVSPKGHNTTLTVWERIADRCTTIEDLIKKSFVASADYVMDELLQSLPSGSQIRDPSLLLQLWQACLKLLSIDRRKVLQYSALTKLLDAIKKNLTAEPKKDCDLLSVVDGLTRVDRTEMRETIRLAIFKTTATLQDVIGNENVMVLGLWSLYCRTWETSEQSRRILLDKLQHVWETTQHAPLTDTVRVSYYYAYALLDISKKEAKVAAAKAAAARAAEGKAGEAKAAAAKVAQAKAAAAKAAAAQAKVAAAKAAAAKAAEDKAAKLAGNLVCKLRDLYLQRFEPTWSMQTLAFQVCSKVWARHLRFCANTEAVPRTKVDKRYEYYGIMECAIDTLRRGDLMCQVAASSMATTLGCWLEKSTLPQEKTMDWHRLAADLLSALPESRSELDGQNT